MKKIQNYFFTFMDGILTFISPCFLPMIPIYISYLGLENKEGKNNTILNALFFVLGFSSVFILLGATASTLGRLLTRYSTAVNIIGGVLIVIMGLNFMGIIKISLLNKTFKPKFKNKNGAGQKSNFISSFILGLVFSIGWTPCVGAFLGSALVKASTTGSTMEGVLLLITYSLGLGIPFMICAIFINQLKSTFDFIKKHYNIINIISGGFLVFVGILMMSGQYERIIQYLQRFSI